jgi:DNA-binding Lrp family transcriptional regulator
MPRGNPKVSDADFIKLFHEIGPAEMARRCNLTESNVMKRRRRLEERHQIRLVAPGPSATPNPRPHPERLQYEVEDGIVLVGADPHFWPGEKTPAWRAFVKFAKTLRPQVIVLNGDVFDGASVSRHPPIGWTKLPTVQQEIEVCQERLHELELAKPMGCKLIWPCGNHDARFETRLATTAPEYAKVHGTSLQDHFPAWEPCWSVWINNKVIIKHRWKGGVHGAHNNTVGAGVCMITAHDHALRVSPYSDYTGTRWGASCGTLADPYGPQFTDYTEDNPRNQRAGFLVLTFHGRELLWPEVVDVINEDHVSFRGEVIRV